METQVISKCEAWLIEVPLRDTFRTSQGEYSRHKSVILLIETSGGVQGVGQVDPVFKYSSETAEEIYIISRRYVCNMLTGETIYSTASISYIIEKLRAAFPDPLHMETKALVDITLHDLVGKITKKPIYELLGGLYREEIPVIGWVGRGKPDEVAKKAISKIEEGYRAIKVKISRHPEDIEAISKIRELIGYDVEIRADANESLIPLSMLRKLERYELKWIEQPAPRRMIDYISEIRRRVAIPILVDESVHDIYSLLEVIRKGAADYDKLKALKLGGLLSLKKATEICDAFGVGYVIGHGFNMYLGASAELHFMASHSSEYMEPISEIGGPADKMRDDIVKHPLIFRSGVFRVPKEAGLGLEVDMNKVFRYSIKLLDL
jgi:L-alanine-DL-glutamate epimerase-like enolase superfamily enzyme